MNNSSFSLEDQFWMQRALDLARFAQEQGEVPVGAVLVADQALLGEGYNQPIASCDPSAHAEMQALRQAAGRLNNYRLPGSTLYVTLEPCMMCLGAILHARIARLVFAAADPKTGSLGGLVNLSEIYQVNHRVTVNSGLMSEEAGQLLRAFFQARRKK